jgi:NADPH:quinone reductase-like Zn-dependent oxidoreductase
LFLGRRVAFASARGGAWAEYTAIPAMRCIPLRRHVSLEQAAMLIVNPLTALAFLDMARRGGHRAIVNNAAASALGRMVDRLGRRHGIEVINIVRRPEQVHLLRQLGAETVLDTGDGGFLPALRELAHRLHATLVLDAVGGAETQSLVDAAPFGATIVVYAGLSGQPSVFNPLAIAGDDKKIVGFYLANWMARRGVVGMLRDTWRVQRLIDSELRTAVRARFPLTAAATALRTYAENMTAGKALLVADPTQVPVTEALTA